MTLMNSAGEVVATVEGLESSGLTNDFEEFFFDEPMEGSSVMIALRGTTASLWNTIREVRKFIHHVAYVVAQKLGI